MSTRSDVKEMIRVDFGTSGDEPTVWLLVDSAPDFQRFCALIGQLQDAFADGANSTGYSDLFSLTPDVSAIVFQVAQPGERDDLNILVQQGQARITWILSRQGWRAVLTFLEAMRPNRHQFFDYPSATVYFSLMESLSRVADGTEGTGGAGGPR